MAIRVSVFAVDDSPTVEVVPADPDGCRAVIQNLGTNEVYLLESSTDTDADGYSLAANASVALDLAAGDGPLYAVCSTGESADVRVIRTRAS